MFRVLVLALGLLLGFRLGLGLLWVLNNVGKI
jgi:hypothetical protein